MDVDVDDRYVHARAWALDGDEDENVPAVHDTCVEEDENDAVAANVEEVEHQDGLNLDVVNVNVHVLVAVVECWASDDMHDAVAAVDDCCGHEHEVVDACC